MKFLRTILGKRSRKKEASIVEGLVLPEECRKLLELKSIIDILAGKDEYIARSAYDKKVRAYGEVVKYFEILINSGMLDTYCQKN